MTPSCPYRNSSNPYSCLYVCLSNLTALTLSKKETCVRDFAGFCSVAICLMPIPLGKGIFCANYSTKRGPFQASNSSFCADCFAPLDDTPFPIKKTFDEEGLEIETGEEDRRFLCGRDGDHLMVPFQCDWCHFRNCFERSPNLEDPRDIKALVYIRRILSDLVWSR